MANGALRISNSEEKKQRTEGHAKAFTDIDKCHSERSRGISSFFRSVTVEL